MFFTARFSGRLLARMARRAKITSAWKATTAPGLIQLSEPKRRTRVLPEKYGGPFKNLHVIKLLIVIEIERTKRRDSST